MTEKSRAARMVAELDGSEDRQLEELAAMMQALIESRKEVEPVEDDSKDSSVSARRRLGE